MSSIRLKKDHGAHKAGATISVPFGVGQTMLRDGVGEYPPVAAVVPKAPAVPPPADRHAAEVARLRAHYEASLKDVRDDAAAEAKKQAAAHAAELGKARAELDAANKQITELTAKAGKK